MKSIIKISILVITIVMSLSFTSKAYTEEQKQQAKAWLSAHGYSPDRGGANQAYQDYLNGKFDEELGVDVNGDGIPATTQAGTTESVTETTTEVVTEDNAGSATEEAPDEAKTEQDDSAGTVPTGQADVEVDSTLDDGGQAESYHENGSETKDESTEFTSKMDTVEETESQESNMTDSFQIEGYQIVMIVIIAVVFLVLVVCMQKNQNQSNDKENL